jgi:hypothetical protein
MKRFVLVAIVALGLVLVSSKPAQAHGVWGFTPGHIGISGSANLSWGAFGFGKLSPAPHGYALDYGYGHHGYGVAPAAPMYYSQPPIYYNYTPAYGYGYYPGCCGQ